MENIIRGEAFCNLTGNEHNYFNYETYAGSLFSVHFPEPTTATLNLLALAGRRRK